MSHHSTEPFDETIENLFSDECKRMKLGPTGKFPLGKLTETDEGEILMGVAVHDQKVVLNFGTPVAWIGFTSDQAHSIADLLRDKALEVRGITP
jgi:hypothetical protein